MKTQIITVSPHIEEYEDFDRHIAELVKKSKGAHVAVASPYLYGATQSQNLFFPEEEEELCGYEPFDLFQLQNRDQPEYWNQILSSLSSRKSLAKIDLSMNFVAAEEHKEKALEESLMTVKNFHNAMADFRRTFGWVNDIEIKNEIKKKPTDILITDLYNGYLLYQRYPDMFSISYEGLSDEDRVWQTVDDVDRKFAEYDLFQRWSQSTREGKGSVSKDDRFIPHITGTWDLDNPDNGRFEVFFVSGSKLGNVECIISDRYGFARTSNAVVSRNGFDFKKFYFLDAIAEDSSNCITRAPINYETIPGARDGWYWWRDKDKCRYCRIYIQRPLY